MQVLHGWNVETCGARVVPSTHCAAPLPVGRRSNQLLFTPHKSGALALLGQSMPAVRGSGFSFQSDRPLLATSAVPSRDQQPAPVAGVAAQPPFSAEQQQQQGQGAALPFSDQHPPSSPDQVRRGGAIAAGRRGARPQLAVVVPSLSGGSAAEQQSSSGGPELSLNGGVTVRGWAVGRQASCGAPSHCSLKSTLLAHIFLPGCFCFSHVRQSLGPVARSCLGRCPACRARPRPTVPRAAGHGAPARGCSRLLAACPHRPRRSLS